MTPTSPAPRAHALIDLDALGRNVRRLADAAPKAEVMAVVKADAYGHGLLPCARAARAAGATWLGVALPEEALALRAAGDTGRILTWLSVPGDPIAECISAGIDVSAYDVDALAAIGQAARAQDTVARVHLKADTGLSRGGATAADWPALLTAADRLARDGIVAISGIWSHLAYADAPGHPVVAQQVAAFESALAAASRFGIEPEVRHLANSAATLCLPATHYDLVRPGIAVYGVSPGPALGTEQQLGLEPVMTLHARLALVKEIPAGAGISYGHEYIAATATRVGLVPLGYADGIPRAATNAGPVLAAGEIRTVAGRVCMDQFVIEVGSDAAVAGDDVVLFGSAARGEPTAGDWAAACDTIGYEIVTRIGPRVPRIALAGGEG
jgi:alanine racemase